VTVWKCDFGQLGGFSRADDLTSEASLEPPRQMIDVIAVRVG
jgi:hypothetical protein